ncbi:paraoxonase 2 [Exophiala viscosa]|uniref:paraoxonase 2 n=1 Tax=Exophiala viscosa TaxID=2486360 RepID=UPI0021973A2F|nr:paraoxonase 2 [Exophiala viscosa]
MSGSWAKFLPLPLLVAALGAIYSNPYPLLNHYGGRLADVVFQDTHASHGPLNNDKCWTNPVGQACEDVRIHHDSGVAFLACGYPETRSVFYPPLNLYDTVGASSYREYFLKYDIKTNTTMPLMIDGLDASHDLILHGIELYIPKDDDSKIYLFAVNHGRRGEEILLFSHILGSNTLTFERSFKHPKVKTPNAVAPIGLDSFFITNDHYFYAGAFGGLLRTFEDKFGPWKWASDIVYCSATASEIDCKSVSPKNSHPSANGALLVDDGKTLMINDVIKATTTIYSVDPVTKELSPKKEVRLGAAADNLSLIPGSEDIAVCIFPDVPKLFARLHNPLNTTLQADAAILRLVKKNDYEPEVLYYDDGSLITVLTGAAVDQASHRLIAGGVVEKHFIVCDISDAKL